ncbi:MAG: hypothetical protein COW26_00690 [Nitrosopumilales archaeon CG15_BIG_FIL_POST_REV_8_21_14_020_33_23]|nr:MAG: hypothetical protein COW26_00690 [Nitrosopumilales archaeon CG15_BIG_FIL_POST_REV_8_21_14_020_33_23]
MEKEEKSEDLEKVQIFSNTDEKLKFLGKILNNNSSREILLLLIEKEMTANEIAIQMKLSSPLVLYHINQMILADIVAVSKTTTNGKNQPMKHYSAKSGIVILPEKIVEKAKESKSFSNSFKTIMKFTIIGIVAISSSFIKINDGQTIHYPLPFGIEPVKTGSELDFLILPMVVLIIGLITERTLFGLKKRKKG